ncbi:cupin domain-containing protein [Woeseia oceani]|uniref:Cupin n=1 Tax=Woeseia oceani TaxID=1548547 RepID=A0A193LKR2_9GAMM|nr:cupin domain-containing protein [Woeseia oceani]ANO52994.1 cupin [Woeseia oceani]
MCRQNSTGSATPTILIENGRTRVTRWTFSKRGDNTGWHEHEYDYVVVPLFDGQLEIEDESGARAEVPMTHGAPYFRPAGVRHDVINGNDFECAFVEVEFLEQPATAGC